MKINRTDFARALRYQRKHYAANPHPNAPTVRNVHCACIWRALQSFGVSRKDEIKPTLEYLDASK